MNVSSTAAPTQNVTDITSPHGEGGHTVAENTDVLLFLFGSCALGALVRQIIRGIKIGLPYTVVLLLLGVLFGLISNKVPAVHRYVLIVNIDPHIILFVFLPVLIFESAFAMDVHTFKKSFFQVLLLAVPGLAVMSLLTCILAMYLFTYGWGWNIGMMFGSILSATDPIAVVAILRDIGASKNLAMITEGESLLNDGAAIVFFKLFLDLSTSATQVNAGEIIRFFLQVSLGGPAFGLVMAQLTLFWLTRIFNDAMAEITITLASTYLTFYIGERINVSGVLAVVVLGVTISSKKTSISPEVEAFLHRFWETLAYLANTLIFILVGVIISERVLYKIHGTDWFFMFALYFGLNVIRGIVIALLSPILQHLGYGMTWQDGLVLTWSGLRGAVGLTLALLVWEDKRLDQDVRLRVLIHVAGVVFLTLFVNATTILHLLKLLGMSDVSQAKRMAMASAMRFIQDLREKTLNMLKTDRFLADADWEVVEKACEIVDPYKTEHQETENDEAVHEIRPHSVCPECDCMLPSQPTQKELRDMTNEAILRMLKAEKLSYWRQFEQGMLSHEAVRKLQETTDCAADNKGKFINVDEIKKSWEVPSLLIRLKRKLKEIIRKQPVNIYKGSWCTDLCYKLTTHWVFNVVVFIVIGLDTVNSAMAAIAEYISVFAEYKLIMQLINVGLVLFYVTEVILKMIPQGKTYLSVVWQVLGLFVVGLGIVDAVLQLSLTTLDKGSGAIRDTLVVFIGLRILRLIRLLEPLLPYILMLVKARISFHLSYGYDLGRGFVAGEDEVRKLIDHIVDNKDIAKQLKHHSDDCKLEVIRCLGLLQKQHPDIALSAKTRQAIRSVLNNMRDGIHELWEDGVLQEAEGEKLKTMVEVKMKRLLQAPPSIPLPAPEKLLNNVTWLQNDERLIDYMKERTKLVSYDYGDILLKQGDPTSGIFIIVSGMVRLETGIKQKATSGQKIVTPLETKIIDFMTTGNIIGEMGLLTHRQRVATVRCETAVQCLFISSEDMEHAMKEFADADPPLEYRLWKVCAIRLSTGVLLEQPGYQGLTKEKIKLRLENAYLVDSNDALQFTVDSSMADVVLVNGFAQNAYTREQFVGPCYIPWTVLMLNLQPEKGPAPIVLVVPSEMEPGNPADHRPSAHNISSEHGEYHINSLTQVCSRLSAQHKPEPNKKALKKWQSVNNFVTHRGSKDWPLLDQLKSVGQHSPGQATPSLGMLGKRSSTPACIETHHRNPPLRQTKSSVSMPSRDESRDKSISESSTSLPGVVESHFKPELSPRPSIEMIGAQWRRFAGLAMSESLRGLHRRRSSDLSVANMDPSLFLTTKMSDSLHDHHLNPLEEEDNESDSDSDAGSVEKPIDPDTEEEDSESQETGELVKPAKLNGDEMNTNPPEPSGSSSADVAVGNSVSGDPETSSSCVAITVHQPDQQA